MAEEFNTGDTFLDIFLKKIHEAALKLDAMFVPEETDEKYFPYEVKEIVAKTHEIVHARKSLREYFANGKSYLEDNSDVVKVLGEVSTILYKVSGQYL